MSVLDLYEPAQRHALEIFLGLFEDEVGAGDGPALGDAWEGNGAPRAETHVVGGTHGEVGEEEEVTDRVGAELEVADRDAVRGFAAEGPEAEGLDVEGSVESVKSFFGGGVEGRLVGREADAAFSSNWQIRMDAG